MSCATSPYRLPFNIKNFVYKKLRKFTLFCNNIEPNPHPKFINTKTNKDRSKFSCFRVFARQSRRHEHNTKQSFFFKNRKSVLTNMYLKKMETPQV